MSQVEGAYAAPGLHPRCAASWDGMARQQLELLLREPQVVAIGEIGLDGSPGMPAVADQERAFRDQLALARAFAKPVLLHSRRAIGRLLALLEQEEPLPAGGILHGFNSSIEVARRFLDLGLVLGFGGPLTYPNARRGPEVLPHLPAEAIVLESDAPDLAPWPHVGELNRPEWLGLVATRVAELRGWSRRETAMITSANARRVLRLGDE
ncbi:TatD family hydrolase [Desulfuromonas carbonis]